MTKKEKEIFKGIHDEAIGAYMVYVMRHEDAPIDVLERACVLSQLNTLFFSEEFSEQGV